MFVMWGNLGLGVQSNQNAFNLMNFPEFCNIFRQLVESMLKRMADQKDSGSSIPGIGGSFDLTDSLILAAPTGYLFFGFLT